MKRITSVLLVVSVMAAPAWAISFSEDYNSYTSGSAPAGPWQPLPGFDGPLVATSAYTIGAPLSYLVGNSGYNGVDKGDYAMLVGANEELQYDAANPLTLSYGARAATAKNSDFYVELSLGDVHAPRLQDIGVGVPLANPIPVVAYAKPVSSSASPSKAMFYFDGLQWNSLGSLDTNGVAETITLTLDGSGADVSSTGQAYTDVVLNYTGGFDRISTYTRDHMWTTAAVIDNVNVSGGFIAAVPEPATLVLLGLGGLFLRRRVA